METFMRNLLCFKCVQRIFIVFAKQMLIDWLDSALHLIGNILAM